MLPGMATPEMYNAARAERELWERNKPMSDEELDALLPGTDQVGRQEDEPYAGGYCRAFCVLGRAAWLQTSATGRLSAALHLPHLAAFTPQQLIIMTHSADLLD